MCKFINNYLKNDYIKVILLTLLISILMFLPNIIKNKGLLLLSGDFQTEQIAFNVNINNELRKGNTLYTFNNDLGSSIIEGYSFYSVANPLFLLSMIFPTKCYPYLISIIFIIKYCLTSLFAFIYFKDFVKKKEIAILGSLLYSFSGFQIFNMMFFHFHDVVMLFPLFLYSIDKFFKNNKKGLFAIILSLTIITNYVFAFGELVFLVIYLIINGKSKRFKYTSKNILNFIIEFLLGMGMSTCILIPSFISIIGNSRISNTLDLKKFLIYPFEQYIKIFQSILLPTDTVYKASIVDSINWSSCEMWIPFFGIIPACIYIAKNKKNYLSITIIVLLIFMFIPILNSSFTFFNTQYYARWYYMPSIFIILMTIKLLDDKIKYNNGITIYKIIWQIYIIFLLIYIRDINNFIKNIDYYYLFNISLSIFCIYLSLYLIKKYYNNDNISLLLMATIICILLQGYHYIIYQSNHDLGYNENKLYINAINNDLIKDDEFYRVKYYGCNDNINLYFNESTIDSFNSSVSPSVFELYNSLGITRNQNTSVGIGHNDFLNFLSVKYLVSCSSNKLSSDNYKYLYKKGDYSVYLNNNYKKLGLVLNNTYNNKKLNSLKSFKEKENLFTNNYIISDESKIINKKSKILSSYSKKISNGVYNKIKIDNDATIVYTIPYDNNFKITINNKKTDYFKINNGLIGVNLKKGVNKVKIIYMGKSYKIGICIGILSFVLLLIYYKITYKEVLLYGKKNKIK